MHIISVTFTFMLDLCYIISHENENFTVSFPGKTMLKFKIIQNPARLSNV